MFGLVTPTPVTSPTITDKWRLSTDQSFEHNQLGVSVVEDRGGPDELLSGGVDKQWCLMVIGRQLFDGGRFGVGGKSCSAVTETHIRSGRLRLDIGTGSPYAQHRSGGKNLFALLGAEHAEHFSFVNLQKIRDASLLATGGTSAQFEAGIVPEQIYSLLGDKHHHPIRTGGDDIILFYQISDGCRPAIDTDISLKLLHTLGKISGAHGQQPCHPAGKTQESPSTPCQQAS